MFVATATLSLIVRDGGQTITHVSFARCSHDDVVIFNNLFSILSAGSPGILETSLRRLKGRKRSEDSQSYRSIGE